MSLEAIALNTSISKIMNREYPNQIHEGIKRFQKYGFRNSFEKLTGYAGKFISNLNYKSKETIKNLVSKSNDEEKQKLVERYQKTGGKGFTLIELLVVISIIGILALLLAGPIKDAREKANRAGCAFNLKNIGTALTAYTLDFDNNYPFCESPLNVSSLGRIYTGGYIDTPGTFRCPSDKETKKPTTIIIATPGYNENQPRMSYTDSLDVSIERNSGQSINGFPVNGRFPLVYDWYGGLEKGEGSAGQQAIANHLPDGGDILHAGGDVEWRSSSKWSSTGNNLFPDPTE